MILHSDVHPAAVYHLTNLHLLIRANVADGTTTSTS